MSKKFFSNNEVSKEALDNMPVLVVSHESDMDGHMAAYVIDNWSVWLNTEIVLTNYGKEDRILERIEEFSQRENNYLVFILDLNLSESFFEKLPESLKSHLVIIDHHGETINDGTIRSIINVGDGRKECSASIVYYLLKNEGLLNFVFESEFCQQIVELTRLRDTWEWVQAPEYIKEKVEKANTLWFETRNSPDLFSHFLMREHNDNDFFDKREEIIIELALQRKEEFVERKSKEFYRFGDTAIVYTDLYPSDIADRILSENTDVNIVAIVFGLRNVSLRSRNDSEYDVGEIARSHGGGGHPHAASFPINENLKNSIVSMLLS